MISARLVFNCLRQQHSSALNHVNTLPSETAAVKLYFSQTVKCSNAGTISSC